jgi:putative membrane protein
MVTMKRFLALTSLLVVACLVLTGAFAQETGKALQPPGKAAQLTDEQYLMEASACSMAEVQIAKLAAERATNPQVKQYAQQIAQDHMAANEKMRDLAEKTKLSVAREVGREHQQVIDQLSKLEGAEFDRAFLQHMIKDHQKAIAQTQAKARDATSPELKEFATSALPKLQAHLKRAQELAGPGREP